jgi:hypothetical protein
MALCGTQLVPSRDPDNLPECPACVDIWDQLRNGIGNN